MEKLIRTADFPIEIWTRYLPKAIQMSCYWAKPDWQYVKNEMDL